ncbi:hypothetical protein FBEOM_13040 [Fusarium beomiforme]|uniref:CNNM transmembrane domain-containing protein n=1 Tax=Fusarium beomiforme TaxID=44412 RepID=A0A9P5A6F4_9HYPO|nr:hypothetical protein FBEOM_13040 [Fusarium beomiforme]
MGQNRLYRQVISGDTTESQYKNAKRVPQLLEREKHWVLLSNAIVNESLPPLLDRFLGGSIATVVGNIFLIAIFGEIVLHSIYVQYGLPMDGYMPKQITALIYLTNFFSGPASKLMDTILSEGLGTIYGKSGLKALVTLHASLGRFSERLNQDEVTITTVLELKNK